VTQGNAEILDVLEGRSRWAVVCGDCLDVLREIPDGAVDAVVTDPPYGINADAKQSNRANKRHGNLITTSRDYGVSDWDSSRPTQEAVDAWLRVSSEQVVFGGNYMADMLPPSASWLVWDKDNGTNGYADFELAWTSHKSAARKIRWRWHGMLQDERLPREEREHPTQKPQGVMLWVIENYTPDGGVVIDPYCGSGSTGVAALARGRRFIGIEREASYCAIARRRIADAAAQGSLFG